LDIQKLSAAKLQAAIDAQDKRCRAFVDAMIDSGRGHERMIEIRQAATKGHDSLARDYCAAMDQSSQLESERRRRRMQYHGKLSPIRQ
jgi:hypothetical protein